jgi:acyl-coenzyme A thioesterase PaaI-like protein
MWAVSIDYAMIGEGLKNAVPWVKTVGIDFVDVTGERVIAALPDVESQRNHVGGPHAAMIFGLGETASGAVVTAAYVAHLDRVTPLPTNAEIRYRKVARGPLTAEAVLGRPVADVVAELDAGTRPEFPVHVTIMNAEGIVTAELTVTWTLRPNRT